LHGGFKLRVRRFRRLVPVIFIGAPGSGPGHDENGQAYKHIAISGPNPDDSVTPDIFIDFAEKLGHLGHLGSRKVAMGIA